MRPVIDFAPKFYEANTAPKVLVTFTRAEGAGMHTEWLARPLYDQRRFEWQNATLGAEN